MYESLVEGKRYKVRLKPLEELMKDCPEWELFTDDVFCWDVKSEYHTTNSQGEGLCQWFSKYLDGSVGYFTPSETNPHSVVVRWDVDGGVWSYGLEQLKILGEV